MVETIRLLLRTRGCDGELSNIQSSSVGNSPVKSFVLFCRPVGAFFFAQALRLHPFRCAVAPILCLVGIVGTLCGRGAEAGRPV